MMHPWLQPYWQQLQRYREVNRFPNALILSGIAGTGKRTLATAIAKQLLCENGSDKACSHCRQCHLFETGAHPDYFQVEPEDSARVIKVEQIRELIDHLNQTPLIASVQVVLLYPLESMTIKAANSLLKTLEEPSGTVFFIFVSDRLTQVPLTVLSRCELMPIYIHRTEAVMHWLQEQLGEHASDADLLLRLSFNAPLKALELSRNNVVSIRNQWIEILNYEVSHTNPLANLEILLKETKEQDDLLFIILMTLLDDIRKIQLHVDTQKIINIDRIGELQDIAVTVSPDKLQAQMDSLIRINRVRSQGIHLNTQLALETVIFGGIK